MEMKDDVQRIQKKKVFICGGGHQGLAMAAHLALNNMEVTLWNRTLENIKEIHKNKKICCKGVVEGVATIKEASDSIQDVFADFIMVTTPSSAHKDIAKKLAPYVDENTIIVLNPGRTFGAIEFANTLKQYGVKKMPQIAETQTIVYTCRKNNANSVTIFALKENVEISAIKNSDVNYIMSKMPMCLKKHFTVASSVAETSLSNVGMVLHCAPVLMNVGWIETEKVDFKYYYDGISKSVAKFLEKIDEERLAVADAAGYKIKSVPEWIKETYKVEGDTLYECLRANKAYKEIDAPPSINSRYITEDVPNGLVPVEGLGKQLGVKTSNITTIINLANALMECDYRKTGRVFSLETLKKYF